ncbi:hypothetical protein INR49_031163 [Caranx melampygus]|nr:hypothetical protein INR49_031163 [Caranx melampygus]
MPRCVKDTLSPLIVKLNYSQVNSENESAILNMDSRGHATVEIPFEKQCAQKETCIADIEVDFNFTTPVLLVSEDNYFNLTVTLSNHGDDSYNTSLTLYYPQGLSFSRMTQLRTESSRQTLHSCHDLEGVFDKTICGISLPVYRSRSAATFTVSFYMTDYEWNDTVSVAVTGKSDNSNMTKRSSQTKFIPVQFDVKLAITVIQDTATYLNFTTEDDKPKKLVTVYKIDNPGLKAFPVTVSLLFPTLLEYDFELSNYQVSIQENKTQCNITNEISEYCLPEKSCKLIQCDYFTLDKESTTEFTLSGDVQFKHLKAYAEKIPFLKRYTGDSGEVRFRSFVKVWYDEKRYTLSAHKQGNADDSAQEQSGETGIWRDNGHMKSADIRVEFIIPADQLLIICTGVGVGFLLLVIITIIMVKLGCFRRRFRSEQELRSLQSASSTKSIKQSVADSKSDCEKKAPENEVLLDDGQTNGSKPPADTEEALE